jgi:hypothetical protein
LAAAVGWIHLHQLQQARQGRQTQSDMV